MLFVAFCNVGFRAAAGARCIACDADRSAILARYRPAQLGALRGGEILIQREQSEGGGQEVRAALIVEAPPGQVWEVLNDYEAWTEFQEHLKEVSVLSRHPEVRLRERVEILGLELDYGTVRRLWPRAGRIVAGLDPRQENDLRRDDSTWQLLAMDHGESTLVELQLRLELGFWVPDFVERLLVGRALKNSLGALRSEILRRTGEEGSHAPGTRASHGS